MASGRIILPLAEPALGPTGIPQTGATLTVYITGTGTLATLYADELLTTPITNPQTSNSAGRFYDQTTLIWADATQAYDAVLDFPTGETFTYDNLFLVGALPAISGFAPLNSPTFTGVPLAPTPATNDNSSKIATTAFVQLAATAAISNLPSTIAATGYIQLGTLYLQWVTVTFSPTGTTPTWEFAFAIPFPTACWGVTGTDTVTCSGDPVTDAVDIPIVAIGPSATPKATAILRLDSNAGTTFGGTHTIFCIAIGN